MIATRGSQQARQRPHVFPLRAAGQRYAPGGALYGLEETVVTGSP
jgi:hypothetical protein